MTGGFPASVLSTDGGLARSLTDCVFNDERCINANDSRFARVALHKFTNIRNRTNGVRNANQFGSSTIATQHGHSCVIALTPPREINANKDTHFQQPI